MQEETAKTAGAIRPPIGTVQSVDRALSLLEKVWKAQGPAKLDELTAGTELDRSTIHRLLRTLAVHGYVKQDWRTKAYEPGPKVLELARRYEQGNTLLLQSRPRLAALAQQTGETAHLAVPYGDNVLIVDHALSSHALGVTSTAGAVEPVAATALGRALISDWTASDIRRRFGDPLTSYTPNTLTSPEALAESLVQTKKNGLAVDNEEYRLGIRCVAAPIRDRWGNLVAAIGTSGPTTRMKDEHFDQACDLVRRTAAEISVAIGGRETT
jgi:IclR family acetate operon transcriptional repressor